MGGGQEENEWCLKERALSGYREAEEGRLLPSPGPQACQGTGAEPAGHCGLTAGGEGRAVGGLIAGPSQLAKAWTSAVLPRVASVEEAGR